MSKDTCKKKCKKIYDLTVQYVHGVAKAIHNKSKTDWETARKNIDKTIPGVTDVFIPEVLPGGGKVEEIEWRLASIGNLIIELVGGRLLPVSDQQFLETTELPIVEGKIVPYVTKIFTEKAFKDLDYDSAETVACEILAGRELVEQTHFSKVRAMTRIDACLFLDLAEWKFVIHTDKHIVYLEEAENVLREVYSFLQEMYNFYFIPMGDGMEDLINFFRNIAKKLSEVSLYASHADYITHQFYSHGTTLSNPDGWSIDSLNSKIPNSDWHFSKSWDMLKSWDSGTANIMQTVEDSVPQVISSQIKEINEIIDDIESIAKKLKDNDSIALLEELRRKANLQQISHYISNYGERLTAIIISMISGIDRKKYDYKLIDEISPIEQRIQQSLVSAASRLTVLQTATQNYNNNPDNYGTTTQECQRINNSMKSAIMSYDLKCLLEMNEIIQENSSDSSSLIDIRGALSELEKESVWPDWDIEL